MEKYLVGKKSKIKINEDFFKVKEEEKVTYVVVVVVLLCFVTGYFMLMPTIQKYKDGKIAYINSINEKNNLLEKKTFINELEKKIEEKQRVTERAKYVLPEEPQVPEILVTLESIASSNALYINNFAPKADEPSTAANIPKGQKAPTYKKMEIQFDVTGSYINFKQFLIDLENNIRPVDIISINATNSGVVLGAEDNLLRFSIKGNIYYQ